MLNKVLVASLVVLSYSSSYADCTGKSVDVRCASYDYFSPVNITNSSSSSSLNINTTTAAGINVSTGSNIGMAITNSTSTPSMTIMGGNVGIGTLTPGAKLSVFGTVLVAGSNSNIVGSKTGTDNALGRLAIFGNNTGTNGSYLGLYGPNHSGRANGIDIVAGNGGGTRFQSYNSGTSSNDTHLVITSAGNVGVGTSTPAYKIHVVGDIKATTVNQMTSYKKTGNDGSVSCENYCENTANTYGTDHGSCLAAKISDNSEYLNCTDVPGTLGGGLEMHCLCTTF